MAAALRWKRGEKGRHLGGGRKRELAEGEGEKERRGFYEVDAPLVYASSPRSVVNLSGDLSFSSAPLLSASFFLLFL